jgi:hypothetical protein
MSYSAKVACLLPGIALEAIPNAIERLQSRTQHLEIEIFTITLDLLNYIKTNAPDVLIIYEDIGEIPLPDFIYGIADYYNNPWYMLRKNAQRGASTFPVFSNVGFIYCADDDITDFKIPPEIVYLYFRSTLK